MLLPKGRTYGRIDKSALPFGEPPRVRDDAWRRVQGERSCLKCGARDGTVVGAHIRAGLEGGVSLKPSDDLVVPLCHRCHSDQEANPGPLWWFELFKSLVRRTYRRWQSDNQGNNSHVSSVSAAPIA
jgi:hypothetical protein